jgi:D-sedoheptulose 7-phosphate isomerase
MNIKAIVKDNFDKHLALHLSTQQQLAEPIAAAIKCLVSIFTLGNKLLICGNGGSAAESEHFAAELTGRYILERPALAAIALTADTAAITAIANDYGFNNIFARQIEALGTTQDVLCVISTSGNSANLLQAIKTAQAKQLKIIALLGNNGGTIKALLRDNDIVICMLETNTARIQEMQLLIIHTICDAVEQVMFL